MKCVPLFRRDDHRWLAFGQDDDKPDNVMDTNQYVVCAGNAAILIDPGGMEVFPSMLAALTREVAVEDIKMVFLSHQDPDVGSSLPLWRRVCRPDVKVYISWLWSGFVAHYDCEASLTNIPDEGLEVSLAHDVRLRFIPAHYLHSPGNFHLYDPQAKILFSGDIGSALLPGPKTGMFVQDFTSHVQHMEAFHRRWIGSARARDVWINTVSRLDIDMLAPQHGLIFKGDDVKRFLEWLSKIEVGSGVASR